MHEKLLICQYDLADRRIWVGGGRSNVYERLVVFSLIRHSTKQEREDEL